MPELPEVETVRLTLLQHVVGRRVARVEIRRAGVVRLGKAGQPKRKAAAVVTPALLFENQVITDIQRLGKQLFFIAKPPPLPPLEVLKIQNYKNSSETKNAIFRLCIHLGMSGSLRFFPTGSDCAQAVDKHAHVLWHIEATKNSPGGLLMFRDPRRFGGIWYFQNETDFQTMCIAPIGPDALSIDAEHLKVAFKRTHRAVKAALLDQSILAGMGNIYIDEALFAAGVDPRALAHRLPPAVIERLAAASRDILTRAVAAGGSTVRTYVDGSGKHGFFQFHHAVYGKGGKACEKCGGTLKLIRLAQRATVFCPTCQKK